MPEIVEDDLLRRASAAAGPDATVTGLRRLEGGISSLTYAATLVGGGDGGDGDDGGGERRPIVLKVAPPGLPPVRNRDVLRQAAVLRALAGLPGFPVPAVVLADDGTPPLFAMDRCPGEAYEPGLDVSPAPPAPETAAARMRVAARALARLHSRTPDRLGVGEEPVTAAAGELDRWARLFATVDADLAPGHDALRARLAGTVPPDGPPALLHGDYRLANMLFVSSRLTGVIDWEIWSVGDPRLDLAWLLMHARPAHVFHEDRPAADRAAGAGLPPPEELREEYLAARRADGATPGELASVAADLGWFLALCHYKTASTTAAIVKRDRGRDRPDPALTVAGRHLDEVLAAGHRALDETPRSS